METFGVEVTYRTKGRVVTASGKIGSRSLTFTIANPLLRAISVDGTFGETSLRLEGGRSLFDVDGFTGSWGEQAIELAVLDEETFRVVEGSIGDKPIRLRIRKEVLGKFVLDALNGSSDRLEFDDSRKIIDLAGRIEDPVEGLAVALLVVPLQRSFRGGRAQGDVNMHLGMPGLGLGR